MGAVVMGTADACGGRIADVVRAVGEVVVETCVLEDAPVAVADVEAAMASCFILPERRN